MRIAYCVLRIAYCLDLSRLCNLPFRSFPRRRGSKLAACCTAPAMPGVRFAHSCFARSPICDTLRVLVGDEWCVWAARGRETQPPTLIDPPRCGGPLPPRRGKGFLDRSSGVGVAEPLGFNGLVEKRGDRSSPPGAVVVCVHGSFRIYMSVGCSDPSGSGRRACGWTGDGPCADGPEYASGGRVVPELEGAR